MNRRIVLGIALVVVAVALLVGSAVTSTAKSVVTVSELISNGTHQHNIRLGARVADVPIDYHSQPEFLLRFAVHDISTNLPQLNVVYRGIMPDTLKVGRDVILEGDFSGSEFVASSLLTQCPSKYEPPGFDEKKAMEREGAAQ